MTWILIQGYFCVTILMIILIACSGCVSQKEEYHSGTATADSPPTAGTNSVSLPDISPVVSQVRTSETNEMPGQRYQVHFDPIPDQKLSGAETISLHGTTNLPSGETFVLELFSSSFRAQKTDYPRWNYRENGTVSRGGPDLNSWSVTIRPHFPKADEYVLVAVDGNGALLGERMFTITS